MTTPTPRRRGFTLVELLVVIAILAVVGAGVAVTYGRNVVVQARRQTTLHEMGQLRDAFARFHADNAPRLLAGLHAPAPNDNEIFPSAAFRATFREPPAEGDRTYGMIEFFERYGLWPLLQPSVSEDGERLEDVDFIVFDDPSPLTGEGWKGPYADAPSRVACIEENYGTLVRAGEGENDPLFPQIGTRWDGFYRVLYLEHCENEADLTQPIYRRLFLVCAEDPEAWDEFTDELGALTGNRRLGTDSGPLDLATGALRQRDESRGLTFIELLNLDIWRNP